MLKRLRPIARSLVLSGFLALAAACGPFTTVTPPVATGAPPTPAAPETEAAKEAPAATPPGVSVSEIDPTSIPVLEPTPPKIPTRTPAETPTNTPFVTPPKPPQQTPTPPVPPTPTRPAPTLTPAQALLRGLPWTRGSTDQSQERAKAAISTLAELDIAQARFLAGSGWVADGISASEATAIEDFLAVSQIDIEFGAALTQVQWLTDPSIPAETRSLWLRNFLAWAPFPDASARMGALPWLSAVPTGLSQTTQVNLTRIAATDRPSLDRLLELPWLQTDITLMRATAIDGLAKLDASGIQALLGSEWFKDGPTDGANGGPNDGLNNPETTTISALSRISDGAPGLAGTLLGLEWIKDGPSDAEAEAVFLLSEMEQPVAAAVATIPWFIDGVTNDSGDSARAHLEMDSLRALTRFGQDSLPLATRIVDMAFFKDSVDRHDASAVKGLFTLSRDAEDWALLTKQPWYKDGINDDEAVVLTVLPPQARSVPTDYQSLVNNKFYLEKTTVPLPLSGEIDLYLVRFLPHPVESATMAHLRMALPIFEEYMGFAMPVDEIIMLFSTNIEAGGFNFGTHFTLDVSRDIPLPQLDRGGIVHEIVHFYPVSESAWFGEGTANFLSTLVGHELYSQPLVSRSLLSNCPGDVTNITEIGAANPGYYPEPIKYRFCYHSYGEKIVRDLENEMGAAPFKEAWQEIFRRGMEDDIRFSDAELYRIFIDQTPTGRLAGVNRVFRRFHGGDFVE